MSIVIKSSKWHKQANRISLSNRKNDIEMYAKC